MFYRVHRFEAYNHVVAACFVYQSFKVNLPFWVRATTFQGCADIVWWLDVLRPHIINLSSLKSLCRTNMQCIQSSHRRPENSHRSRYLLRGLQFKHFLFEVMRHRYRLTVAGSHPATTSHTSRTEIATHGFHSYARCIFTNYRRQE